MTVKSNVDIRFCRGKGKREKGEKASTNALQSVFVQMPMDSNYVMVNDYEVSRIERYIVVVELSEV